MKKLNDKIDTPKVAQSRRKLLKGLAVGGGVLSAKALPDQWAKPLVDATVLPAHAQTTPTPAPTPCSIRISYDLELTDGPGGNGYVDIREGADFCGRRIYFEQPAFPTTRTDVLTVTPGTYGVQFGGDGSGDGQGSGRVEIGCCDEVKVAEWSWDDGSGEANIYAIIVIAADGTCSITETTRFPPCG